VWSKAREPRGGPLLAWCPTPADRDQLTPREIPTKVRGRLLGRCREVAWDVAPVHCSRQRTRADNIASSRAGSVVGRGTMRPRHHLRFDRGGSRYRPRKFCPREIVGQWPNFPRGQTPFRRRARAGAPRQGSGVLAFEKMGRGRARMGRTKIIRYSLCGTRTQRRCAPTTYTIWRSARARSGACVRKGNNHLLARATGVLGADVKTLREGTPFLDVEERRAASFRRACEHCRGRERPFAAFVSAFVG
jgi:hypothetical protein